MRSNRAFGRAVLLRGAAFLISGLAAGLVPAAGEAASGKRLAFSQRLGAEIFAVGDGADWCRDQVTIQVVAESKALFGRPDFETLIKSLGSKLLAAECPAAQRLVITGLDKATGAVAWTGKADNTDWKPVAAGASPPAPPAAAGASAAAAAAAAPALAPAPVPAPAPAEPPPPPLPVSSSPLGGNWTGTVSCGNYGGDLAVTLSVYEAAGNRFKAVWEHKSERAGITRLHVDGQYDDLTNQISVATRQNGVIRAGDRNVSVTGTVDLRGGQITARTSLCYNNHNFTLARSETTPVTAHRVLADAANEKVWTQSENSRPRDWWIVGKLPAGQFRMPACGELAAWAGLFPTDLRVRLFPNSSGMLRHFDDATTQRVFGSPAYHWLGSNDEGNLSPLAQKACGNAFYSQNDAQMRALRTIVQDYNSVAEIRDRRKTNNTVTGIAPYLATRGDEPADAIAGLNRFASMEGVANNIREFGIDPGILTPEEKSGIAKDVIRYKAKLAEKASRSTLADIAALPETLDGLDRLARIRKEAVDLFGADVAATVTAAADARRGEIAKAVTLAAVAELGTMPRNFDGMMDADLRLSAIRDKLRADGGRPDPAVEPMLRDLDAAETRFRQEARDQVIRAAQDSVPATPATADGARALTGQLRSLEKALGKDAGPSFAGFQKAAAARLDEIGRAVLPSVVKQLDTLPTAWTSIDSARRLAAEGAAPFAGSPAEAAFTKAGEDRVQGILSSLADQAILDVKGVQDEGLSGFEAAITEAARAAVHFAAVEGGRPIAERILEAGRKRADEIAEAFIPRFRDAMKNARASRSTAIQLAAASLHFGERSKDFPAMAKLRDIAQDGAAAMYGNLCDKALSDAGISASDGRTELLVGSDITTVKQFVCDLNEGGIRTTKFETPGLLSGFTGGEKPYVLRLFGPEERLQPTGLKAESWGRLAPRRFASLNEIFAFGDPPAAPGRTGKAPIESPAKIVFKEMEIRQNQKSLVGVQIGDDAKTETLSLREWRTVSTNLAAFGKDGTDAAALCALWARSGPKDMPPYEAALALLTCQAKK